MSTTLPFAQTEARTNYLNVDYGWKSTREISPPESQTAVTLRRGNLVAVYHRPQTHCTALSVLDHSHVFCGRRLRRGHAIESANAPRSFFSRHLQQAVHHARDYHGVLLPGPVDSRDARQFSCAAHDWRARPGVSADQFIELVYLHRRWRDCADCRCPG